MRVSWEPCPNRDVEYLHCDRELFRHFEDSEDPEIYGDDRDNLTDEQNQLIDDLHAIHGLAAVCISQYSIMVHKGRVFSWDEIRPRVESVLRNWGGEEIISPEREPMIGKYHCIQCEVEFRPKQNGAVAVSYGTEGPLEALQCDIWACPQCGFEIVAGVASGPRAIESADPEAFQEMLKRERDRGTRIIRTWLNQRERQVYDESHAVEGGEQS